MKVVVQIGNDEFEVLPLADDAFQEIIDSPIGGIVAIPTHYRASDPKQVWPLPRDSVTLKYLSE